MHYLQAMDRRAASLRQEQEAARSEILLFQKAVAGIDDR